jgi:hypothetical protein
MSQRWSNALMLAECSRYALGVHLRTGEFCRIPAPRLYQDGRDPLPHGFARVLEIKRLTLDDRVRATREELASGLPPRFLSLPRWMELQRECGEPVQSWGALGEP